MKINFLYYDRVTCEILGWCSERLNNDWDYLFGVDVPEDLIDHQDYYRVDPDAEEVVRKTEKEIHQIDVAKKNKEVIRSREKEYPGTDKYLYEKIFDEFDGTMESLNSIIMDWKGKVSEIKETFPKEQ